MSGYVQNFVLYPRRLEKTENFVFIRATLLAPTPHSFSAPTRHNPSSLPLSHVHRPHHRAPADGRGAHAEAQECGEPPEVRGFVREAAHRPVARRRERTREATHGAHRSCRARVVHGADASDDAGGLAAARPRASHRLLDELQLVEQQQQLGTDPRSGTATGADYPFVGDRCVHRRG